jgi:hypothetical protein
VTGKRLPIGDVPGPRWRFRPAHLFPFQPQQAWLEGSVLSVEYKQKVRQCDLLTASRIDIRIANTIGRYGAFQVLEAWQEADDDPPVRLVLSGPTTWVHLTDEHLRLLAQIIHSRPGEPDKGCSKALRTLDALASYQKFRPDGPVDWSFRTEPQGLNRQAEDRKADDSK